VRGGATGQWTEYRPSILACNKKIEENRNNGRVLEASCVR